MTASRKWWEGTGHVPWECDETDPDECRARSCNRHAGELTACAACGGAEGTLPTHCPGVQMTPSQWEAVFAQELNFFAGIGWCRNDAPGKGRGLTKEWVPL